MEYVENSFVDKPHNVQFKYYELVERSDVSSRDLEQAAKKLIKKDPDFLDSYLLLYEVYQEEEKSKKAEEILDKAYERAIDLITDKNGNWPDYLAWGFTENRHIIRTVMNKAVSSWHEEKTDEALDLFRKLLKTNPPDNVGARDYILAIRMGLSFEKYEARFNKGGYYDSESIRWFEKNAPKYPDEFGWWFDWIEENM